MSKEAMKRALEAFESVHRYGLDTLSGRVDGPDDRDWQRAGVNEMTKRSRLGITALRQALANEALDRMVENDLKLGLDYTITQTGVGIGKLMSDHRLMEQPAQQEPVAWQYRDARDDGTWGAWLGCDKRLAEDEYRQVRALYTAPQPAPVQQSAERVEPVACRYGDNGYACCEGGPCAAEEHNDKTDWQERGMVAEAALAKLLDEKDEPVAIVSGYYGGQCVILPIDPARIFNSNTALYTSPAQRKPLTDEQIMAIGKELGLKCRLGGNPNIDFDYARAIEAAHGIKENT